ncbi:MAG: isoprenyl transferase [Lactobacillaceae bacterium]|jgi:undecaprenyl diphosphate synthase|nr:isoprenyl transferase [Lactobacillaceae bacterium]
MGTNESTTKTEKIFDEDSPVHIAIIMDGNGRWAKSKHKPRVFGHQAGMNKVKEIALYASSLGVKYLTLYAFSTENWKRPNDEVKFLMKLPIDFFGTFMPDLIANNVQVKVIGDIKGLPDTTREAVTNAIEQTKDNDGLVLTFAMNYGGQQEIVEAAKTIARGFSSGSLSLEDVNVEMFGRYLQTGFMGDHAAPDLMIRTSGEQRISNYLLYQSAYSEFFFTNKFWPDFNSDDFDEAIQSFLQRDRRFGKV